MKLQCSLRGFFAFEISLSNPLSPKATGDVIYACKGLVTKDSDALLARATHARSVHTRCVEDHRHLTTRIYRHYAAITARYH
jgi:hypothetical protein